MTSKPMVISKDAIKQSGSVSIFPTLIHADYALVNQDAVRLKDEYNAEMNMNLDTHTISNIPGLGPTHVTALTIPYSLPDRLALMTRFCELTFLNDDYYDDAGTEKVQEYNDQLQQVFGNTGDGKASMGPKAQQLQARFLVEMLQVDRTLTTDLMATYSRILDATSLPKNADIKSLGQYLPFRVSNSGLEVFQDMCCFGMGLRLTHEEKEKLAPIVNVAHHSTFLINDFWSWPKELNKYFEKKGNRNLPVNAVCILMQEHGCSEEEARQRVKDEIVTQQTKHLAMIQELESKEGPLPDRYMKYFDAVQFTASGSEFWSCYSPRYPTKEDLHQPECFIVDGQLRYKTSTADTADTVDIAMTVSLKQPLETPSTISELKYGTTRNGVGTNGILTAPKPAANGTQMSRENGTEQRTNGDTKFSKSVPTNGSTNGHSYQVHEPSASAFLPAPNDTVLAPYKYIASLPSKNIREKFIDALNLWLQVPQASLSSIKKIVAMLHHSSLMLDDIEDNSTLRRAKPCTHILFGPAQTINSANYAFVSAFAELQNLRSPLSTTVFIRELQNMHCGQALDLSWKYHAHCPTVDEYMMMIDNKTGAMFRLCVQLMQAESSVPCEHIDPSHFVTQLGRYFQVRDDYQNLVSTEYSNQKGFCEDLDEGKISLPLIYTLISPGSAASVIKGILQHKSAEGLSLDVKRYILDQMGETGALDATQSLVREMQTNLIAELHRVEDLFGSKNSIIELILRRLWV